MRLVIDIDLARVPDDPAGEAGRMLRYWAGALSQLDLGAVAEYPLMDSNYRQAGTIRLHNAG